jgi:bacteriocin-like protein
MTHSKLRPQEIEKAVPSQNELKKSSGPEAVELSETELNNVVGGKAATPILMKSCATGSHIKEAKIT